MKSSDKKRNSIQSIRQLPLRSQVREVIAELFKLC